MKKIIATTLLAGLASLAFAGDFNLSAGLGSTGADIGQANYKTRFSFNPFVDFSYNLKTEGAAGKLGLYLDDSTTLIQEDQDKNGKVTTTGTVATVTGGDTKYTLNSAYSRSVLKFEPYADLSSYGVSYKVSFPTFLGLANEYDKASTPNPGNTASYAKAWDISSFGSKYRNTYNDTLTGTDKEDPQTVLFTTYGKVGYKFTFDKIAVTPALEYDVGFVPAVRLVDIRPWVSVAYAKLATLDAKVAYYTYGDADPRSGVTYALTAEPKLTVDFSDLGVKNLKASLDSFLYLTQTDKLKGDSLTPAVSYKIDAITIDVNAKISNFDDAFPGYANAAAKAGADLQVDPTIKVTYGLSF